MPSIQAYKQIARSIELRLLARRVNFSWRINVGGSVVKIPFVCGIHASPNERWMYQLLEYVFPIWLGSYLDVGANKGQNLIFVKALDPMRHYIGIDPNPANVYYMQVLVQKNGWQNSNLMCFAIGEAAAAVELHFPGAFGTSPAASIVETFDNIKERESITVAVLALDSMIESSLSRNVGILKIDVEGAESAVLAGSPELIARDRPLVIYEAMATRGRAVHIANQIEVSRILSELDYETFRIVRGSSFWLDKIGDEGVISESRHFDYLAVPRESVGLFGAVIRKP